MEQDSIDWWADQLIRSLTSVCQLCCPWGTSGSTSVTLEWGLGFLYETINELQLYDALFLNMALKDLYCFIPVCLQIIVLYYIVHLPSGMCVCLLTQAPWGRLKWLSAVIRLISLSGYQVSALVLCYRRVRDVIRGTEYPYWELMLLNMIQLHA